MISFYATARPQVIFSLDLERQLPLIEADPEKLRQVFINLVENGLDSLTNQSQKRIKIRNLQNKYGSSQN